MRQGIFLLRLAQASQVKREKKGPTHSQQIKILSFFSLYTINNKEKIKQTKIRGILRIYAFFP